MTERNGNGAPSTERARLTPMNDRMADLMQGYPFNPDRFRAMGPAAQAAIDARRAAMAGGAVLAGPISIATREASADANRRAHQPGVNGNGRA